MDFPGFLKSHPVSSIVITLALLGGLAYTATNFTQGTLVDDQAGPCTWQEAVNTETGEVFDSKQGFRDYIQENGGTVPEDLKLKYRDGTLHFKTSCGTVGGGTTQ
jgi:hypothetical protein